MKKLNKKHLNHMKTLQKLSPIEQALQKAREHFGAITTKPYYNEQGFVKYPPMNTQGQEIKNPAHSPNDLPVEPFEWDE